MKIKLALLLSGLHLISFSSATIINCSNHNRLYLGVNIIGAEINGQYYLPFNNNHGVGIGAGLTSSLLYSSKNLYGYIQIFNDENSMITSSLIFERRQYNLLNFISVGSNTYETNGWGAEIAYTLTPYIFRINYLLRSQVESNSCYYPDFGLEISDLTSGFTWGLSSTNLFYIYTGFYFDLNNKNNKIEFR